MKVPTKSLHLWNHNHYQNVYLYFSVFQLVQRCVIVIKIIRLRLRLYELVLGNRNRLQLPLFFVRLNRLPIDCNFMFCMAARENIERKKTKVILRQQCREYMTRRLWILTSLSFFNECKVFHPSFFQTLIQN